MASGGKDLEETTTQPQIVHNVTGVQGQEEATAQPIATQHPQKGKGNFPTGYECEFVEPPPKILTTECTICLQIPRDPQQVSCCGQHFCKSCIEHARSENKPCPLCNQLEFTTTLDKNVQRHLGDLKVYCTHKEQGCEWVGELRHLDRHLNANPTSGEELTGCGLVELSCIHGCGGKFQRHYLTEHHNNFPRRPFSCEYCSHFSTYQDVVDNHWPECPKYPLLCPNSCEDSPIERQHFEDHQTTCPIRPFSCEYCSHSSTYRDVVTIHWVECPQYPLQCPNSCEDSPIERQHYDDHLKECPLEKVNCEFQYAGCTAQVQRRDMAAHMRDNLPHHISQLSSTTRILAADNRDEIEQKFEQITVLKDQVKQHQQRVEGMVKQEQAEAKAQKEGLEGQLQELKEKLDSWEKQTITLKDQVKQRQQRVEGMVKQEQAEAKAQKEGLEGQIQELKEKLDSWEKQTITLKDQVKQRQQRVEGMVKQEQAEAKAQQQGQLQELKQMIRTASDNTQRQTQQTQTSLQYTKTSLSQYGMIVAAIIIALVAVFAAVIIMHQQIQQLQQGHIEATEQIQQLQQGHIEATEQIQQLQQGHIEATEQIQQLQQDHIEATEQPRQGHIETSEQIEQLRQDHIEATEQIQQLQQDHIEATEQIQQLRQGHINATKQPRQGHIETSEQIEQLRQDYIKAIEQIQQLQQDHNYTTEKLSDDLQHLQYALHIAQTLVSPYGCTADGPGLHSPTVNVTTEITVSVVSILGLAYSGKRVNVTAELESDGSVTQANVSCIATSKYRVTFIPRVRGSSQLYVKVNNIDIKGSPFSVLVGSEHPQEIGWLNQPWGIAINSHGEIFVTEWGDYKVSMFDTNQQNRPIRKANGLGLGLELGLMLPTGDGKFMFPAGIDIDADDNVYVASQYKLQKFNRNGEFVKSFNSNDSEEIRGVKVHDEKVYVCDLDNDQILVYDLELTFIRQFGSAGTGEGEFNRPFNIDFDAKGNAYVVDSSNHRVQVLKEDGQFLREFGREKLKYPRGIHIAGDYVYVSQLSKVVVFRTSGDFVTTIGENFGIVYGITTDSNGSLYICDYSLYQCIIL